MSLFKRSKSQEMTFPHPGRDAALDGHAATFAVESSVSDELVVQTAPGVAVSTPGIDTPVAKTHFATDARAATTRVVGASAAGLRVGAMVDDLSDARASLSAAAGKRLTAVYHLTCRALPRHAGALHGGHDDYYGASDAGLFQLFARGVQEAADFALIAHRVAERALTPGICAQDYYRTSHSVQTVRLPEAEFIREFLGESGDVIETPTPAQNVLFGDRRRRVPRAIDPDHPAGIGGLQDSESYFKAMAAQRTYFADHLRGVIADTFAEFGAATGRPYESASGYRVDDAEVVVLAQGAVVDELEAVADYLRDREKIKAGVINLAVFRPFPGAALTRLLRGRRAVTVLERTDRPLAETLPMTAEVRAAIDRAIENGTEKEPIHPDYAVYRPEERPRVFSGVYGVGGELPSFEELIAVYRNMAPGATASKTLYYIGLGEDDTIRRFPHLHSLQQELNRDYPGRNETALPAADVDVPATLARRMRLYAPSSQGGIFAGNLLAQTLATTTGTRVRTFPHGGLEPSAHAATLTLLHAEHANDLRGRPTVVATALVSGGRFIEDVTSRAELAEGGALVVATGRGAESLWKSLSRRSARWIRDHKIRLYTIDANRIASETASQPSYVDQLAVWALLGAYAALEFSGERLDGAVEGLRTPLSSLFGESHYLLNDIVGSARRGAAELTEIDHSSFETEDLPAASDGEAPWTVKDATDWDDNLFDGTRFWHSVGYLYDSGQSERALADPYLATGVIPARSSAFRDMTPYRLRIPQWLPENCTGCGLCWALCPDSALPPRLQSVTAIVETAMTMAEGAGVALVQMKRFADHLCKLAYRMVAKDGGEHVRAGELFDDAFARLLEKAGLDEEKQGVLQAEFDQVRVHFSKHAIAKTETFFNAPHESDKGSGELISIALNPLACTGCGVCVDVCEDQALEMVEQTPELVDEGRQAWQFGMRLPEVGTSDIDRFVSDGDPASYVNKLFDSAAYHTLVGGDGSYPGNSAKTAVRLVAGAVESVMAPRFDKHVQRLADLIDRLESRIQGDVSSVLKINDFESFSRELDHLQADSLTPDALASAVGDESASTLEPEKLRRLTGLLEALKEQKRLYETGADGHGRARMAMTIDSDAARLWSGTYPYNPLPFPWACHVPGDGLTLAEGIYDGIARRVAGELAVCRAAEAALDDRAAAATPETIDPGDLTEDERRLIPPVLVLGEVGTTSWDDVGHLMAGDTPIRLILINPGAPLDQFGVGVSVESNLVSMARGNPSAFVAQAGVGRPGHLLQQVVQGVGREGPSVFHVLAPDPLGSGIAPEKTAAQSRLAVDGRVFPSFTVSDGRLSIAGNADTDSDWPRREVRFREPSGDVSKQELLVTVADWAIGEARFQGHFRVVSKGELGEGMVPLAEYIDLDDDARERVEPFVHFADENQRHFLAVVSSEMANATEAGRDLWRWLRQQADPDAAPKPVPPVEEVASEASQPTADEPVPETAPTTAAAHQKLTERLLQLSGFSADPEFFSRSLREFVVQRNVEASTGEADDGSPRPQ